MLSLKGFPKHTEKIVALLFFTALFFQGCFSVKPQASQSRNSLYESFFLEGSIMQYFIKPLEFQSKDAELSLDVTLRDSKDPNDEATLNFSIFSEKDLALADSVAIVFSDTRVSARSHSKLFFEKTVYRYTSSFDTPSILHAFLSGKFTLLLYYADQAVTFAPTSSTSASIAELNASILKHFYLSN
ncbi:hypothetical protein Ctha_2657 [Chloroherpeton thalassium ATCC 35110]|uniref:Lipoprotein n=2 Tax=Chloroherpeton thalassium TaxID=100716 RepID=B3QYN3_CHLT3|nr:hypothetical protein Ctha_2657 [Chloroherpeton thalassium ATCC 35110]